MGTFGKDTPLARPEPGERAAVFVPRVNADKAVQELLKNGAGMVGFGNSDGSVTVYYENNRFNDSTLFKWESKVFKAYERMVKRFPTVNKLSCDADNLDQIGILDGAGIRLSDVPGLTAWLARTGTAASAPETQTVYA